MKKISLSLESSQRSELKLSPNADKSSKEFPPIDYKKFSPAPIIGVDEVGRGCLAGPVYAAAVCLKSENLLTDLTDSKLVSEKRREILAPLILKEHWVGIGFATVAEIDEINILQASLLAMKRAVQELQQAMGAEPGHLLIDGNFKIPGLKTKQTTIIKGDLRCAPISAASIVAKVARDHLMREMDVKFPGYDFGSNKGYGSATHKKVISEIGPCVEHRKTFRGVKEFLHLGN